jgi:uncharacterized membrane protein
MKLTELIKKFTQAHWLFVIIALIFGFIFISLNPPLWGADERAHFYRAYQVSEGRLFQNKEVINGEVSYGDYIPSSFKKLGDLMTTDVFDKQPYDTRQVDSKSAYIEVGSIKISQDSRVPNPFHSLIYPTITYIAPALGMAFVNLFNPTVLSLMYSARIATLLFYILLVFFSIFLLRRKSVRWIIFVVALLPMALYQASIVSADSVIIALSLILFSFMYRIICDNKENDKYIILGTLIVSVLLALIKPPYAILILPLLLLPLNKNMPIRSKRIVKFLVPFVCLMVAGLASINASRSVSATVPYANFADQLHWLILHPAGYLFTLINSVTTQDWVSQMIGIFGTSFIIIPSLAIQILLILLAFTAFIKTEHLDNDKKEIRHTKFCGLLFLSTGILACLAIITSLYLTYTHIGASMVEGIQGRYFIPVIAFILVGLRMLTRSRLIISEKSARIFFASTIIFSLIYSIAWYYKVLY